MSTETFLVGDITLKKGVNEEQARRLIADISEYTEVSEAFEGIVDYMFYSANMRNKLNGKALIIKERDNLSIRYSDISYSSHIYSESVVSLKEVLKENKHIIEDVNFSLYYLSEADENIFFSSTAEPGEIGSWDA